MITQKDNSGIETRRSFLKRVGLAGLSFAFASGETLAVKASEVAPNLLEKSFNGDFKIMIPFEYHLKSFSKADNDFYRTVIPKDELGQSKFYIKLSDVNRLNAVLPEPMKFFFLKEASRLGLDGAGKDKALVEVLSLCVLLTGYESFPVNTKESKDRMICVNKYSLRALRELNTAGQQASVFDVSKVPLLGISSQTGLTIRPQDNPEFKGLYKKGYAVSDLAKLESTLDQIRCGLSLNLDPAVEVKEAGNLLTLSDEGISLLKLLINESLFSLANAFYSDGPRAGEKAEEYGLRSKELFAQFSVENSPISIVAMLQEWRKMSSMYFNRVWNTQTARIEYPSSFVDVAKDGVFTAKDMAILDLLVPALAEISKKKNNVNYRIDILRSSFQRLEKFTVDESSPYPSMSLARSEN